MAGDFCRETGKIGANEEIGAREGGKMVEMEGALIAE